MLFAGDFVGVSGSKEGLQKLISVVHGYCNKWRFKANVSRIPENYAISRTLPQHVNYTLTLSTTQHTFNSI